MNLPFTNNHPLELKVYSHLDYIGVYKILFQNFPMEKSGGHFFIKAYLNFT